MKTLLIFMFALTICAPLRAESSPEEIFGYGEQRLAEKDWKGAAKEFSKAADSFSQSVKADSTYAPAFYGLALSYANQGKYPEALENVQRAIKLDPGNAQYKDIEQKLKQAMSSGK